MSLYASFAVLGSNGVKVFTITAGVSVGFVEDSIVFNAGIYLMIGFDLLSLPIL